MTSRMEVDLAQLMSGRVRELVCDVLDTAKRGGISRRDRMLMVLTVLLSEAITGLIVTGISEADTVDMHVMAYREIEKRVKVAEAQLARRKRR